jgi:CBS domain-containing protein
MTKDIVYCTGDQDVEQAMRLMGDKQVRRLPVVDNDKNLLSARCETIVSPPSKLPRRT